MERTTVAVIGAGFAGLTAARALRAHGIDVVVLEAADRVGGRARTERSAAETPVDLGGQWIGHDHTRMTALATEFGMTLFPTPSVGKALVVDGGRRVRIGPLTAAATGWALLRLELLARRGAHRRWDEVTASNWVGRVPGSRARRLLKVILSEALACDLDTVSVAALAAGIRSAGGLRVMLGTAGGAQESLLSGGAGALAEALAVELNDAVHLARPVTAITRSAEGVTLATPSGSVHAARAIVTVPAPVAAAIRHDPRLPADRRRLQDNVRMGTIYKAIAVYDRPFWRELGLSGEIVALDGPVPASFDISPPTGPGHLCVLIPGRDARELDRLTPGDRRDTVLSALADHLGPAVLNPLSWHEKSWHNDPFVGGGYSGIPFPGTLEVLTDAAKPTGPIHWAGTETAPRWTGYFEGAVVSGERAADEVVASLRSTCLGVHSKS
ncbi:flavin monoamine oxidase family protein [Nocardia amikacinitolerans]|uniref:flavin monoamine oxidase family protein n=1 Tax=Nocardia amikacinitolerans TaxID=756689 RepID=UPI0020A2FAE7|nr:NAD(P)/FAD-dependent oxidoreductase [Nocardia amikacinitolerans]MCP2288939.1 monoamine oxidase [Nocardia amikacinitolerans]